MEQVKVQPGKVPCPWCEQSVEDFGKLQTHILEVHNKCCKFHNRLDLKYNDPEFQGGEPDCGLAGSGSDREIGFCCENCPDRQVRIQPRIRK